VGLLMTLGFLGFIGYLFRRDVRQRDEPISWAPLVWMFLAGSRWVSSWLSLSGPLESVDAYAEGSPVDRAVFFALIIWGGVVLARRNLNWSVLIRRNIWIVLYLSYCLSSIIWTDEPFILAKRWIKDLGGPIMALVILTETRPYQALGITLRRLAFLLLPLSVMFIRYYPELGRSYHNDGSPMYTGIGHQKNDLGLMCLMSGLYFAWKRIQRRDGREVVEAFDRYDGLLVAMLAWLIRMSDSQTSLSCLIIGCGILGLSRLKFIWRKPSRLVAVLVSGIILYVTLDQTLGVTTLILELLGRDPSLTNRTELWDVVLSLEVNSIIGAGFMSFWAGDRMRAVWDALGAGINQAHNGYLEQYLNLGYVGVAFIAVIMLAALWKITRQLDVEPSSATLRLCLLVAAILYNYTEASFYGINNMWLGLLVASLDITGARALSAGAPALAVTAGGYQAARVRSAAVPSFGGAIASSGLRQPLIRQ
jgi:exopolysaccharide production protein ExoQ